MKKGDRVQFMFQGSWEVSNNGYAVPNIGEILRIDNRQVIVKSPGGAKYYLSPDMVRLVK